MIISFEVFVLVVMTILISGESSFSFFINGKVDKVSPTLAACIQIIFPSGFTYKDSPLLS